jgi:hypothetical protein
MNMFLALALGGVLLFLVGRSLLTVLTIGQREMTANDRRLALVIVVAVLVAFVVAVLFLQFRRG